MFNNIFSLLLTAMLNHGTANDFINRSTIKPIQKDIQKSLSDSTNYRAISKTRLSVKYLIMFL